MKNVSLWVMVLVLALIGSAIWYEVQYRQSAAPEQQTRIKRTSSPRSPAQKPGQQQPAPASGSGELIG